MKHLDTYLNTIQENEIQEVIDPIVGGALIFGSIYVITNLAMLLMGVTDLIVSTKVDPELSKEINKILSSGNKWIIHKVNMKEPNAFSLGFGRHIFITSELQKMVTKDELDAILLHEVYHSEKKHTIKKMAYEYPLFYLVAALAVTVGMATANAFLVILAIFIASKVQSIIYNLIIGRRMEYNADSYAAKMGYGKELISGLNKIEAWAKKRMQSEKCEGLCKVISNIDRAIDEHPEQKDRIENILKHSKELMNVVKTKSFSKIKNFLIKSWGK